MARGIDHLVLCVNDLEKAKAQYEALGFTVTPRAQHPFGTGNVIVQFDGCFLEILSVTRPSDIPDLPADHFSFPKFNRAFLQSREGMSMLVLDSEDEAADRRAFEDANMHVYPPFTFERQQTLPSGQTATVGFALTFTDDRQALKDMGFFTCRQWRPDLFWKTEYQSHKNGAATVTDVFIVSDDPTAADPFLSGFTGVNASRSTDGKTYHTARGNIVVLTRAGFNSRFPDHGLDTIRPPHFGGFAIGVSDIDRALGLLRETGTAVVSENARHWIDPNDAFGCVIELKSI